MLKSLFFYSLLYISLNLFSAEYLYPVAQLDDKRICIIYQKNHAHIELWLWDTETKQAVSGLFTHYTPAGIKMLPNGSSFSFIDHGLIKIKSLNNAIPHILELNKPLSNITVLHWIDDYRCYTHAQQGDYFGLFLIHIKGKVTTLAYTDDSDLLYPQKIDDDFYYIEKYKNTRCFKYQYRIMKLSQNNEQELILNFGTHALAFLTMISDIQGFVVEHPQRIKEKKKAIQFIYYSILKEDDKWQKKELFTFTVPLSLLIGSDRLYESMLPILPRKIDTIIYFVSLNDTEKLSLYAYDLVTNTIIEEKKSSEHFFVPIETTFGVYSGGAIQQGMALELGHDGDCTINLRKV